MKKEKLKDTAKVFVGNPEGLIDVDAPGNGGNHVFVRFSSQELMRSFVSDNSARAATAGLRLKHNRPQGTPEERKRRETIWKGRQDLTTAGMEQESISFFKSWFWKEGTNDTLVEIGVALFRDYDHVERGRA